MSSVVGHTNPRQYKQFRVRPHALHYGFITSNLQKSIRKSIWNQLVVIINPWKKHILFVTISEGVSSLIREGFHVCGVYLYCPVRIACRLFVRYGTNSL